MKEKKFVNLSTLILALFLTYFTFRLFTMKPYPWIMIDNMNLLIHEAGHLILGLVNGFGSEFVTVLAGTVFQIGFPLLFVIYFIIKKEINGVLFSTFWFGEVLINVGVYMKDAAFQVLPMFGHEGGIHDWIYTFSAINQLHNALLIGNAVITLGYITITLSTIVAWCLAFLGVKPEHI